MSESYYSMKSLMEPEGWPPAHVPKIHQTGCSQPIKDKAREERLDEYRDLVEQNKPLFKEGEGV